jgi:hypothetical protein
MPSFKERFRPSRKYKKNKEASTAGTDESTPIAVASGISTNTTNVPTVSTVTTSVAASTTNTTIDENTGSAALSTYHSHYSNDQCECRLVLFCLNRSKSIFIKYLFE